MESYKGEEMQKISINDALKTLEGMLASVMVTGAIDSEPRDFEAIKSKMLSGDISPGIALKQAQELIDSRQSYH
ncbi:MAG: hypothetical protein RLZZ76_380 [Candidatus Parcubacteria bacterium]|jgi:hypothetical protein